MVAFSQEVADSICERIANGISLREICRAKDMPDKSNFLRWMEGNDALRDQYARAMADRADHWAEEILEIADDGTNDWMERQRETKGVRTVENAEAINRSRLRVDSRKWLMSKLAPKKYGDKIDHNVSGGVSVTVSKVDGDL